MMSRTRSNLKRIYDQDLPVLPKHWHQGCKCVKTVAYIRVSKVGKRTTITSPKIQLDEIVKDARANGRRIVKIVFDINVSGANFDRQALNEVMGDLKVGEYSHISVWKWSRWGRNLRGSLEMIAAVEDLGASIDSATEPFDIDTVWGEFGRDQSLVIAALQGKVIGQGWRSAHANRLEQQLPHSGRKRFGYVYNDADERNKHYELHSEESSSLAWAYEAYLRNTSLREIAREFAARGHRTEFDNLWTWQAVGKMLDTGFGAGLIRGRSEELKKIMKRKPANKLSSYDRWDPGKQPQVIDMTTWNRYKERRLQSADTARAAPGVHEASSLLFCGICARRMSTKYFGRNNAHHWICQAGSTFHPERNNSILNAEVLLVLKSWFATRAQPEWVEAEAEKFFNEQDNVVPETRRLEADLAKLTKSIRRVMSLYEMSDDDSDEARTSTLSRVQELEVERARLKMQINALKPQTLAPNYQAIGLISERWDDFKPPVHNAALTEALALVVVAPRSAPRVRDSAESRITVVPRWEVDDWEEWLSARRSRSA